MRFYHTFLHILKQGKKGGWGGLILEARLERQTQGAHNICPFNTIFSFLSNSGSQGAGAYPNCHRARGMVHTGQVTSLSLGWLIDRQPFMPTFRSRSVPINITLYMSLSYGRILEAQYWILLFLLSDYSAPTPPWPLHNILVPKKGHSDARSSDFCKCMLLSNIFFIHLYFFILLIEI